MSGQRIKWGIIIVVLFVGCSAEDHLKNKLDSPPEGFVSLFNGQDLSGWTVEPDNGTFYVKDGAIVCTAKSTPPEAAFSERMYENFILELEYRIEKDGNSGIFIHAPWSGRQSRVGFELQIQDNGDTPTRYNTGAIYDALAPKRRVPWKVGKWNHVKLLFDWPKAKVWWNGTLIHDTNFSQHDELKYRLRRGTIGLQNHGANVEFKNIWIKELPDKEKWTMLFNGGDLSGWKTVGNANWHVEDGEIVATKGSGFLVSQNKYQNFELQSYVERGIKAYGGLFYRWLAPDDPGYEAEFYNFSDARKYTDDGRHVLPNTLPRFTQSYLLMQIISHGRESKVLLNGLVVSNRINHTCIRPGHIAFQFHPQNDELRIHEVKIKDLD